MLPLYAMAPTTPNPIVATRAQQALLLKPRDAAAALAVSERQLFDLTRRGLVRAVRIGRSVRYDPRDLISYIDSLKEGSKEPGGR